MNHINVIYNSSLAGLSRSVSLVIAYLMVHACLSFDEAMSAVQSVRSIRVNSSFQKQLRKFEFDNFTLTMVILFKFSLAINL